MASEKKQQAKPGLANSPKKEGSFFKQFILAIGLFFIVILLRNLPIYGYWLDNQIGGYYKEYKKQKKQLAIESRWESRQGYDYIIPRYIQQTLDSSKDIFLMPPEAYLRKKQFAHNWTNTRWFYYMAERKVKLVYPDKPGANKATHSLTVTPQGPTLIIIDSDSARAHLMKEFGLN